MKAEVYKHFYARCNPAAVQTELPGKFGVKTQDIPRLGKDLNVLHNRVNGDILYIQPDENNTYLVYSTAKPWVRLASAGVAQVIFDEFIGR